jgi:hypothetical protein
MQLLVPSRNKLYNLHRKNILPNIVIVLNTKCYKAIYARRFVPSFLDNNQKRQEDKQTLINNLVGKGGVCYKVYDIKGNGADTQIEFNIDDIKKPPQEDGFGVEGFDRPYIDELLQMVQNEDGFIEIKEGGDKFRLTQKGINRCLELQIQQ